MKKTIFITQETQANSELLRAFQDLMPQLTTNHPPATLEDLKAMMLAGTTTLLTARAENQRGAIVGALALVIYRVPTGVRARIEDVIVEKGMRGQGIGKALVYEALRLAKERGSNGVTLTSHPRRVAANLLYQRIGFKRWKTNLYYYPFN